ncbi:hypothetical protein MHY85_03215 [Cellulomonas sp. ACRRI]|uniref:hypothetical protein n=1 Tax=Cellulomonas sp. ACRRI TaxID=2918188 RepID=UPI001EF1FA2E|nr:hypothetical protein [Cellulomonas sp. ACRRI]MCG7284982.1 hypothetical protein [Cellulomonas sp. ACRRI]
MTARKIPGEFVPLHVHFQRDPRLRGAGANAELLFIRALAHARVHKTDGAVTEFDLRSVGAGLRRPREAAQALVREGLWITTHDGWQIRSWEKWNGLNTQATGAQSRGGTTAAHNRWHRDRGEFDPDCPLCADVSSHVSASSSGWVEGEEEEEREGEKEEEHSSEVADATSRPDVDDDPRPEVLDLLDFLDERVQENGFKKPARTKANRSAARLLLDRDGRTVDQVRSAITWATDHEFWRLNIRSMSKLRQQYDRLQAQAAAERTKTGRPADRRADLMAREMEKARLADEAREATKNGDTK